MEKKQSRKIMFKFCRTSTEFSRYILCSIISGYIPCFVTDRLISLTFINRSFFFPYLEIKLKQRKHHKISWIDLKICLPLILQSYNIFRSMDHDAPAHPILRLSVRCFVCSHECRQMPALLYDPGSSGQTFRSFYLPLTLRLYNCHDIIPSICLLEVSWNMRNIIGP